MQAYISLSKHVYTPITFVMNQAKYDSLTDEQRASVNNAARAAVLSQPPVWCGQRTPASKR